MKKMFRFLFVISTFVCLSFFCFFNKVSAKSSSSYVFEVDVGEGKLPINYNLVNVKDVLNNSTVVGTLEDNLISMKDGSTYTIKNNDVLDESGNLVGNSQNDVISMINGNTYTLSSSTVREKMVFSVTLKGLLEEKKSYRWEHTFCYKIAGYNEICEKDLTGSDQKENSQSIYSNETYNFSFWDGHMPYYDEELIFEYVIFKNKFVCLETNCNEEIVLDDIEFSDAEINYYYNYDVIVDSTSVDSKEYINSSNTSAKLVNNTASSLILSNAPEYKFINKVCVEEDNCNLFETDKVYKGSVAYPITPYIGNIDFTYNNSYFVSNESNYEQIVFKTILQCLKNCDSRRIERENVVVYEKTFEFDYKGPAVDKENTIIASVSEYVKSVDITIKVDDLESGIASDGLIYQIIIPTYGYCDWGGTIQGNYNYENGVRFTLGSELQDGPYCMRYYAYDNAGNNYVSDYYVFYFDNSAPKVSLNKGNYNSKDYYNEVKVKVNIVDMSKISEAYYLWSKEEINEEDSVMVKGSGSLYKENGEISSLDHVNSDGKYYLYMLVIDDLGHSSFNNLASFNIDITALNVSDVIVNTTNMDGYSRDGIITLSVDEMGEQEIFKCGLFKDGYLVVMNDLNLTCVNNETIVLPSNLEGKYSLWAYVHDRANNYSLLEVKKNLLIDTKGPDISYSILKDDDNYHLTNEINIIVTDLNDIKDDELKYGWFSSSKNNVTSTDLSEKFVNGESIGYPTSYYGEYKLYISAKDSLDNEKFICVSKIFKIDTDVIRISLVGDESVTILKGEKYVDGGAKAYKGSISNGGRVSDITTNGEVDVNKAGVYYITYSSGEGSLLVSVTRKVIVKSDIPYIAISGSLFVLGSVIICVRLFLKKKRIEE